MIKPSAKPRLVISDMYRAMNKTAFFAIHQALTRFSEFDIEFHILWDDVVYADEWTNKIKELNCNLISYTKEQLDQYCIENQVPAETIAKFVNFKAVYFVIHGHLLRKKGITNYYLIYDDDVILREDIDELRHCLRNKIPCLVAEPMNAGCDKSMANILINMYEGSYEYYTRINPQHLGFNAGFQGISLDMYDDFMEPDYFNYLLNLFSYDGILDADGKEITGFERTKIDTQQQSFFSIMNIIRSKTPAHILNPTDYYTCPNWGYHPIYGDINTSSELDGWEINLKSKVVHFIGHSVFNEVYYGKPRVFDNLVDEYLKLHKII